MVQELMHDCRHNNLRCLSEDENEKLVCCYVGKMLCPICGVHINLKSIKTIDGRVIGSCGDAFREDKFYVSDLYNS